MTEPRFFGYGSLVNLATHAYGDPRPARLPGWGRVWRHTAARPFAYLSSERVEGGEIDGVTAEVPGGDWAALDLRETNYVRRDVTQTVVHDAPPGSVAVYEVDATASPDGTRHPILMSYLDVVIQGYVALFGTDGADRFFATTRGWGGPIRDDRAAPLYSRPQAVGAAERGIVDDFITREGLPVQT